MEASLGLTEFSTPIVGEVQPSQGHTVSAEDWCKHNQSDSKGCGHLMSQHPLQQYAVAQFGEVIFFFPH